MNKVLRLFFFLILHMFWQSFAWAAIPTSPDMHLTWVGQNINHNGMKANILHFSSDKPPENIIQYYERAWADPVSEDAPGHIIDGYAQWRIISRLESAEHMVIQVSESSAGSVGYISHTRLDSVSTVPKPIKNIPIPPGGKLISHTYIDDEITSGLTLVFISTLGVSQVSKGYQRILENKGYTLSHNESMQGVVTQFYLGKKGRMDVAIGPNPSGGAVAFLNVFE